ncbi:sialate O-acetylesterase [Mucilaginibacter sp. HD30]
MKKVISLFICLLICLSVYAQSEKGMAVPLAKNERKSDGTSENNYSKSNNKINVANNDIKSDKASILHINWYGQSLSVLGSRGVPATFFGDMKTFAGGVLTEYDPDSAVARDAYYGTGLIAVPTTGKDRTKPAAAIIKKLIHDENGTAAGSHVTMLVNATGVSGENFNNLSLKTGKPYRRLLESIKYAHDFALKERKNYDLLCVGYFQGEASSDKNKTYVQWYGNLKSLFTGLNTDIKALLGKTKDQWFVTYQIASFAKNTANNTQASVQPSLATLQISMDMPNVIFGTAMYQYKYSDALHLTYDDFMVMDATVGVAIKRSAIDGKKMEPIKPLSWKVDKSTDNTKWVLSMKMHVPSGNLVLDTSINSQFTTPSSTYGFLLLNALGVNIIKKVTISGGNTLIFECVENPKDLKLTYCIDGVVSGGNLRDTQGDTITTVTDKGIKRVDNWCPIFELYL